MIVVRLWGGLGNQLFQYACGYALARHNSTKLVLDTRFFTDSFLRENKHFSKQKLNIMAFPIEYKDCIEYKEEYKKIYSLQKRTTSRLIRIPSRYTRKIHDEIVYEKETRLTHLDYIVRDVCDDVYLDGYWQSYKYFSGYEDDIRKQFCFESDVVDAYATANDLSNSNTVAVHMRLGDYAGKKKATKRYNYLINPQYYINAIEEISCKIENPRFFVFSNDMKKARTLVNNNYNCVFVNEDRKISDIEEFAIMSRCSNHIISNSTFSWWGAWLSSNANGIKIAPDMFFGNDMIIPDTWAKVKVDS